MGIQKRTAGVNQNALNAPETTPQINVQEKVDLTMLNAYSVREIIQPTIKDA